MENLLDAVGRHTDAHSQANGVAASAIPGLTTVRATMPSPLLHAIPCPLLCLVLQGSKHVTVGREGTLYAAGDSLLITADAPTISQITGASRAAPYLALVLELDAAVFAALIDEGAVPGPGLQPRPGLKPGPGLEPAATDAELADAALRLMHLLDRPASVPILHVQLVRELHYWLLTGRHGPAVSSFGRQAGPALPIRRAIARMRADFAQPLPVDELAVLAAMSRSSFHHHFRKLTSLSPLQFQKRLRLIEAQRLMRFQDASASSAAFAVGYESVPQFTRDYSKLFGAPPVRDLRAARTHHQ